MEFLSSLMAKRNRPSGSWYHPSYTCFPFGQPLGVQLVIDLSMFCQYRKLILELDMPAYRFSLPGNVERLDLVQLFEQEVEECPLVLFHVIVEIVETASGLGGHTG